METIEPKQLLDFLGETQKGKLALDAQEKMEECIRHASQKGGKTTLTITLQFVGAEEGVNITAEAVNKVPKSPLKSEFLFVDAKGRLYDENPLQIEMEFYKTDGPRGVVKNRGAAAG